MALPDFSTGSAASFVNEVFPVGLSLNSVMSKKFRTDISQTVSGRETRVGRWATPRIEFDIGPAIRTLQDLRKLEEFFDVVRGAKDAFLFHHPLFHTTGAVALRRDKTPAAVTATDMLIGTGTSSPSTTAYQLSVTRSTPGGSTVPLDIKRPIVSTVLIAVDGTPLDGLSSPPDFTVDATTGIATLAVAPGDGLEVTAGFKYYIPVRFMVDELQFRFEQYAQGAASVRILEVRDFD